MHKDNCVLCHSLSNEREFELQWKKGIRFPGQSLAHPLPGRYSPPPPLPQLQGEHVSRLHDPLGRLAVAGLPGPQERAAVVNGAVERLRERGVAGMPAGRQAQVRIGLAGLVQHRRAAVQAGRGRWLGRGAVRRPPPALSKRFNTPGVGHAPDPFASTPPRLVIPRLTARLKPIVSTARSWTTSFRRFRNR
jgi:hypothetical protein